MFSYFRPLTKLQTLDLGLNFFKSVSGTAFASLRDLRHLNIVGCHTHTKLIIDKNVSKAVHRCRQPFS